MPGYSTYDQVGKSESFADIIANISPFDTPAQSLLKTEKVTARTYSYLEDTYRAAAVNAIVEGADASMNTLADATERSGTCQIMQVGVQVTGTADAISTYGRAKESSYQIGTLRLLGEDVSEILELITAKLKVIEIARLKKSCRRCEKITQPPAPSRPIPRSMVGPGLLAHILVAKFDDHLPLYRQNEIFARMGADIPSSTLVDWCGQGMRVLAPLIARIRNEIMASDRLHTDDTPIKVLDPSRRARGIGKGIKEGRIWTYVRDDRPWGGSAPPGAVYYFSTDRKGEHPQSHLAKFEGILQADAFSGYKKLYEPDVTGAVRVREAACWAHLRRDFHDVWTTTKSEIAREALDRIGALYDIEREITGQSAEQRNAVRQKLSKPKVEAFKSCGVCQQCCPV